MKRVLVVFYTQSGQLRNIADSVVKPLLGYCTIDYLQINPAEEYPFPWKDSFFDCFPESVMGVPCKLKTFKIDQSVNYDLIILAYQSWFLSPSIPITSFLKTQEAENLFYNKPVITLLGIRNMWIGAHEIIKKELVRLNAQLVGNIVLRDRHDNWIAGITIIRWLVYGKKDASGILPAAGVSDKDISEAGRFGHLILRALKADNFNGLQKSLLSAGAVKVKFHLMLIESNARKIFKKFAVNIINKGNDKIKRKKGITIFKFYLLFALFLLSPFFGLLFSLIGFLAYPVAIRQINYYEGVSLK